MYGHGACQRVKPCPPGLTLSILLPEGVKLTRFCQIQQVEISEIARSILIDCPKRTIPSIYLLYTRNIRKGSHPRSTTQGPPQSHVKVSTSGYQPLIDIVVQTYYTRNYSPTFVHYPILDQETTHLANRGNCLEQFYTSVKANQGRAPSLYLGCEAEMRCRNLIIS